MNQDFTKKIVIVARQDIAAWQAMNAIAHIAAYIGSKMEGQFDTGENFVTKDGKNHPRNSQYAIIVLGATTEELADFIKEVRQSGLLYHGFFREMIDMSDDQEIVDILAQKLDDEIEYLGIGVFGQKEKVDELTKKFKLWKLQA